MKRNKYVKRVLITLLVFVLSFSLLSMLASVIFYGVFFTRSDILPGYTLSYDAVDPSAYPRRQVRFRSGGNNLTAYYYSCESAEGIVVIAAGFGENSSAHLAETTYFVDNGFNVFSYDGTGVGESEGNGTVGLSQPALDLHAALDYISSDSALSSLPVFLYGHSAGGYAAAVNTDSEQVRASAIISGFESPTLLMRESARSYVGFLADIEYPFLSLENYLIFSRQGGEKASEHLCDTDIPVIVYEGVDDHTIPAAARLSNHLDFNGNPNLTLIVCEKAPRNGHSGLWLTDEAYRYREGYTNDMTPDSAAANALDASFMNDIIALYRGSLR